MSGTPGRVVPPGMEGYGWGVPDNFLGLDEPLSRWEGARALVLPVPYEATTSYGGGTREGPRAILEASRYVEFYDPETNTEPCAAGICTLPAVELGGSGPEAAVAELRALYRDLLEAAEGRFVVGLGGEHSISSAPVAAWAERLDGELSVLQLDAHSDLRESYQGSPWSHASVMRRVAEHADRICAVGIRSLSREERSFIRERGITTIFAEELRADGWIERALEGLGEKVYLTFDVDFLDPSILPATGTPEPGGAGWWQALDLLRAVFRECEVVGADLVELAPRAGLAGCDVAVAELAYKMIAYRLRGTGGRG